MRGVNLLIAAVALGACSEAIEPRPSPAPSALSLPAQYDIVDLGTLGGGTSQVTGINDQTQIVGASETAAGTTHAFLWTNGVMEDLGTLGGDYSSAAAINGQGDVAGVSTDTSGAMRVAIWLGGSGVPLDLGPALGQASFVALSDGGHVVWAAPTATGAHAMMWDGTQVTDLGTLGGATSRPVAVNARGQVAGTSTTAAGPSHAFLWENGVMRDLGTLGGSTSAAAGINEAGAVTGTASNPIGRQHAFFWNGEMTDLGVLAQDFGSSAAALSARDQVVGISYPDEGAAIKRAFMWELGVMRPLRLPDDLTFVDDRVRALNDNGQVIGVTVELNRIDHPWVWEAGVTFDLPTLGNQNAVIAINNAGHIIGWSSDASGSRRAILWQRLAP